MTARFLLKAVAVISLGLAIGSTCALAAPGDLDTSFGTGGEIVSPLDANGGIGRAVLVQPDGKIVVAGNAQQNAWWSDFGMIRYLPDGSWDPSFGLGGRVNTGISGYSTSAASLARQSDGQLLVAGWAGTGTDRFDFGLARYQTNGTLDTTFGNAGLATLSLSGANGEAHSMAVQPDGKIVLAGEYEINAQSRMVLARFLADGTLDTSFGDGGKVVPFIGGVWDSGNCVAIQPDGKIVVGGTLSETNVQEAFVLVRLNPNGVLDGDFGVGGKVVTQIGGDTYSGGQSVVLQDDGKIVLAGYTWGDGLDIALARYLPDGTLDSSFGGGGMVVTSFTSGAPELAYGAALQSDGRILVTGTSEVNGTNCLTVMRYLVNGALDTSFGSGGRVTSSFGRKSAYYDSPGRAVVVQSDGKIVAAGGTTDSYGFRELAVARYLGTTEPEIAVEQPAGVNLKDGSASIDFGLVATSAGTATRTFTIKHPSTATLVGLVVSRDGANGEDFSVSQPNVSLLGPGGSTTFTVTFAPTAPGLRKATLHVASNDADENPFDIAVSGAGIGQAGPGAVDAGFGSNGRVTTAIGAANNRVGGMALQSDGKLLVAGYSFNGSNYDFALVRYRDDLSLDTTFGNQGVATSPVGSSHDYGQSVAIQPDGKIVVVGNALNAANSDIALVRYEATGALDASFGNGGKVISSFSDTSGEIGWSVAVQGDGKIVVAGFTDNGTVHDAFAVVRYLADGALDPSFGSGGKVSTAVGGADDQGYSVTLQRDGKIVVAGQADAGDSGQDLALVRYLVNGELDAGFGSGGKVITSLGAHADSGRSVTVDGDGTILVAGVCGKADINDSDIALVRYLSDGQLANGFGSGGVVITDIGGGSDDAGHIILLQSDGKIVVAGSSSGGANYDFAVVRHLANGTLDTGFGKGGKMVLPVGDSDDFGWDVVLQRDGKLVAAGDTRVGTTYDFAVVRLLGTTTPEIAVEDCKGNNLTDGGSTVDFGQVRITMSPGCQFTVRNPSTATLTGLTVSLEGTNAGDFSVGTLATNTLGPGESTSLSVIFIPQALGLRTAAIHITSNDADENPFDIALTGTVVGPTILTPGPLPAGMVGVPYNFTFQAAGGNPPYTWICHSPLPNGLTLSSGGLLSGTPAAVTTNQLVVSVTGADGARSVMATPTLTIVPALHPGDLDPSFGNGGKVTTAIGSADDFGYSAVLQLDGKIVVGGYSVVSNYEKFALARYSTDGSLDTSFGNGGTVTIAVSRYDDFGRSVALQSDGKLLLAGEASGVGGFNFAMVRLQTNGALDTTFGTEGKATNAFKFPSYARTVLAQHDGRIVMAGQLGTNCADYGVACYLPDGTLDTTFGSGGRTTTDFTNSSCDYPQGAALQADGKILVAGYVPGDGVTDFGLVRYLVNGTLDPSFGIAGKVTTSIGTGQNLARSVAVQSDGKILVTGEVSRDFGLVRYLPDGSLDASFGSGGTVTTAIDRFEAFPRGMAVQSDGGIVVVGYTSNGKDYDFALACYNPDGTLDVSFNDDGKLMTSVGSGHDRARSVFLQPDGKIVVAGESYNGTNYDFALVRYIGSLEPEIAVEHPAGNNLTDGSANIDFGIVSLTSTSVVRTVTLKNLGAGSLTGLAITKDGVNAGDFSVETLPTTSLAPGASVSFNITFTPSALGSRTAAIHIASNDASENPFDLTLTGTGGNLTPLQAWRLAHFGSAENSGDGADTNDFDKDGVGNLLEYAFGGDPKTPDAATIRPVPFFAANKFSLAFKCDAQCIDITYTVQAAASIEAGAWIDVARSIGGATVLPIGSLCEVSDAGAGLRTATVIPSAGLFPDGRGFVRIKISE